MSWNGSPVAATRMGADHEKVLRYIAERQTHTAGWLNWEDLRGHRIPFPPTVDRDGFVLPGHDEVDCVVDLVRAGLVAVSSKDDTMIAAVRLLVITADDPILLPAAFQVLRQMLDTAIYERAVWFTLTPAGQVADATGFATE